MTSIEIRQLIDAASFQPFRLHLAGGRVIEVKHPEFARVFAS